MNVSNHTTQILSEEEDDSFSLTEYFDILLDNRWLIACVLFVCLLLGLGYALLAEPIFESNLTVQVEDSDKSAGSFLGDAASSLFEVKTPAAGEIEIIRSRMILGQAVENIKLYISAKPKYAPVIGGWLARRSKTLSDPGFWGVEGYVSGAEKIVVPQFEVPSALEGAIFSLTVSDSTQFVLSGKDFSETFHGVVGKELSGVIDGKRFKLLVSSLAGKPGAKFEIISSSKLATLSALQNALTVVEKGKQSGVLDIRWQNADPEKLIAVLNEIGRLYVRQNVERKAAEAEKTISFLDTELPKFRRQLEQSEDVYNKYRNQNGTVSLDEEAKNALAQTVDLQAKLIDAQQRRRELSARFTDKHPSMQTLDAQIAAWNNEINGVDSRIRKMPMLQQSTLRMQRDIKVNTDLYVSLLNSLLQMRLAKEGKVGNVRLLDEAVMPLAPVRPQRQLIVGLALVLGLLAGAAAAIARSSLFSGIRNPNEIEAHSGLNVYSTIPLSAAQIILDKDIKNKVAGTHVLAISSPEDPAVESLRSLRTALQFAMLEASNNRVVISGGTPGVGKSFVSVNFASIVAASGKKVLLIDADLRKGHINQVFGLVRAGGLSELISGTRKFSDVVRSEVLPNLDLLATGVLPPNPAELLMSDSFVRVLDAVSADYDLVIIDTAPVLVAADTVAVAPHAGTLLLVARAEKTNLGELNESVRRIQQVGCKVDGVILNAMNANRRHYGSYGYRYGAYRYTQYKYGSDQS